MNRSGFSLFMVFPLLACTFPSARGLSNLFPKNHDRAAAIPGGSWAPSEQLHVRDRRSILQVLLSGLVFASPAQAENTEPADSSTSSSKTTVRTFVKGTVILPTQYDASASVSPDAALYVTCRPDKPDNVPRAVLDGSRGKPPPVLTARFASPFEFPFVFELNSNDITLEGQSGDQGKQVWWQDEDLIVSARLDMDGRAATRSPEDLVGRSVLQRNKNIPVEIALTGRGAFGKFATAGSKK